MNFYRRDTVSFIVVLSHGIPKMADEGEIKRWTAREDRYNFASNILILLIIPAYWIKRSLNERMYASSLSGNNII